MEKITLEEAQKRLLKNQNETIIMSKYYSCKDNAVFECLVCGNIWETIASFVISGKSGCNVCNREKYKISKEEIENRLSVISNSSIELLEYVSLGKKAHFLCKLCGNKWWIAAYAVINEGKGCRACKYKQNGENCSISREEVEKRIYLFHGDNIKILKYIRASVLGTFQCNNCGHIWDASPRIVYTRSGCPKCCRKTGSENHMWKGGITVITDAARNKLDKWVKESLINGKYKCYITGRKDSLVVHHLYSFNLIVDEVLSEYNLCQNDYLKISNNERKEILTRIVELNNFYGLGIPLTASVHKLFHKIFGKGNNIPEQFQKFLEMIDSGEIQIPQ